MVGCTFDNVAHSTKHDRRTVISRDIIPVWFVFFSSFLVSSSHRHRTTQGIQAIMEIYCTICSVFVEEANDLVPEATTRGEDERSVTTRNKAGRRSSAVTIGKDRLSLSLSLAFLLFSGCIINKLYYAKKYLARYIQFMRGFSLGTYKRSWPTQETWNVATDGVPLGFEESNCKFT